MILQIEKNTIYSMENKNIDIVEGVEALNKRQEEESSFDFRTIITMLVLNWQWFLLSAIICLCLAFIYLRYKSPVYQVTAKVLIKDEQNKRGGGSNQMLANMQDLGFMTNSTGFDNEIEIIGSLFLAREAVKELKLYTSYYSEGTVKDHLMYKTQPVNVDIDPASLADMDNIYSINRIGQIKLQMEKKNDSYNIEGTVYKIYGTSVVEEPFDTVISSLPATLKADSATLTLTENVGFKFPEDKYIETTISAPTSVAGSYVKNLNISPTSKTTTIAVITIQNQSRRRGEDFLRQLVACYNDQANADKNEIALKTEEFINGRLEKINAELGMTESELEDYKKRHNLTNLKLDATETLTQAAQYENKLNDAKMQIQLLDYLREYINQPENKYQIIPSNVGLQDVASTTLIQRYNQNVLDRNRMLQTASERAPQVLTLTSTLDDLQKSIKVALEQARRSADINMEGIKRQYAQYQSRIENTPEQERILTQIGRQQEVRSGLYMMLLQKREENSISLAATADKGKMIDDPLYNGKVSPKSSIIMLLALIVGLGLPMGILFLLEFMRYKIEGREDVEKHTPLPIVADVPVANPDVMSAAGIVVQENKNNQIDEVFRSMRTNIQFLLHENQKVVMFTSSTSGEGKTFNAANLSMSLAFLGKRIILLGLDIRKPALGRLFGISDKTIGITPLLGKEQVTYDDIKTQIRPSGSSANLDLLLAGPIPPNPTELLARKNLSNILEILKQHYDYVVLDTAPVGLVTDTLQIGKLADVSVLVCRADYTPKSCFEMLNSLVREQKLHNACVVVNGVDMSKKKYGYYYGYGKYATYGKYGRYGRYGGYGSYGAYSYSHYSNKEDNSIKL